MKRREKLLGIGLLAALGIAWKADSIESAWASIASPVQTELSSAGDSLEQLEQALNASRTKCVALESMKTRTLPADPAVAGTLYQELLVYMIDKAGMGSPTISIASPIPLESTGHILQFSVQLKATLAQLGSFIEQFESTSVMHQVKQIQIHQTDAPESGQCNINMVIEALSLDGAEGITLEAAKSHRRRGDSSDQLASSNLMRRPSRTVEVKNEFSIGSLLGLLQKPDEIEKPTEEVHLPKIEPSKPQLVGIIGQGDDRTALVSVSPGEAPVRLNVQSTLGSLGLTGLVSKISSDSVHISNGQSETTLRLGEFLEF